MLKTLGNYLASLHRRICARWFDSDENETLSNVVELVCGKDSLDEARDERETHAVGMVLPFLTKEQRLYARQKIEREHAETARQLAQEKAEAARRFVREEALARRKLVILSRQDPRLRECCLLYFEKQPVLSEYLVSAVISANGSLQGLRLVCSELAKAFPNLNDDVPIEIVEKMRVESDVSKTKQLVIAYWSVGGHRIRDLVYNLVLELQGDRIPVEGVPMSEWLPSGNGSVPSIHYDVYGSIFACACVMILATKDSKRKTHAA